jgi:hypothetical protein
MAALAAAAIFGITQLGSHLLVELGVRGDNGWLPGMIAAGETRQDGQWAFWDVRNPEQAVIIHLADERHARLVIG